MPNFIRANLRKSIDSLQRPIIEKHLIEIGGEKNGQVTVESGLALGERVVTQSIGEMSENMGSFFDRCSIKAAQSFDRTFTIPKNLDFFK